MEIGLDVEHQLKPEQFLQLVDDARLQLTESFLAYRKGKLGEVKLCLRKANDKIHTLFNSLGKNGDLKPKQGEKKYDPNAPRMSIRRAMEDLGIPYWTMFRNKAKEKPGGPKGGGSIYFLFTLDELREIVVNAYQKAQSRVGIHSSGKIDKTYEWLMDCFDSRELRWSRKEKE